MTQRFSQAEAFPVIARLICDLHERKQDFVTHDDLVAAFLNDEEGRRLIDFACEADPGQKSREWWASNMVQWFSQRITEGKSEYESQFERVNLKGSWAYKPAGDRASRP